MTPDAIFVNAYAGSLGRQYIDFLAHVAEWCGTVLDPRPDLAIPARRDKLAYCWWW